MTSNYPVFAVRGPVVAPATGGTTGTARLVNIASRAPTGGPAGTPIAGFVIAGGARPVLVRAVGPTLGAFGLTGFLADPRLSILNGSTTIATNDNWLASDAPTMAAAGAFALGSGSRDAAVLAELAPAAYTAPLTGPDDATGVALLEIYDTGTGGAGRIANASIRAFVGTGDSVLIPGFVIGGAGTLRLLVRAVGPGLANFGVPGSLPDPTITLFRDGVPLATNDNWSAGAGAPEIAALTEDVGAFALASGSRDAALLATLAPGAYTAVVSGVAGATGTALIEIYTLP